MEKLEGTCGASLGWGRAEGQKKKERKRKRKGIGLFYNTFGEDPGVQDGAGASGWARSRVHMRARGGVGGVGGE